MLQTSCFPGSFKVVRWEFKKRETQGILGGGVGEVIMEHLKRNTFSFIGEIQRRPKKGLQVNRTVTIVL